MSFSFYKASPEYCDFLRTSDPCVPYTKDGKETRPFVGIVFSINGFNYFAPLSSPKPKHRKMKNQIDFLKIAGGEYGAINFNNMIPIHPSCLQPVDIAFCDDDSKETLNYKNLLANQLSWCNKSENAEFILHKAKSLYYSIKTKTARHELVSRCCDFAIDESQYLIYCKAHGFPVSTEEE